MITRRTHTPRRGHTLVEMLVAILVFSTMLGLSIALIESLFRLETDAQRHAETLATISRLSNDIRHDIRHTHVLANRNDFAASPAVSLALQLGTKHTVDYTLETGALVRRESTPDGRTRVERYALPRNTCQFVLVPDHPERIILAFDRRSSTRKRGLPRPVQIEAALGANLRYAAPANTPPKPDSPTPPAPKP